MRGQNQDQTPTKSSWQRNENDFYQAQRQKYEKSELSYYQSQNSNPNRSTHEIFSEKQTHRGAPNEHSPVYNQNIPFRVKSSEREDYQTHLRIQIFAKNEKAVSFIEINLTDDRNPYAFQYRRKFLWKFLIRETEFMALKNEQKLKVDYNSFSEMLQKHFQLCESENGEGVLSILESNRYKQSVHLYLNFKMCNDEQIKEYLSSKLVSARDENQAREKQIKNLESMLSMRMIAFETLKFESKEQNQYLKRELESLRNEERKKYNQLKEKSLDGQEKMRKEMEKDKRDIVKAKESEIEELKFKKIELEKCVVEMKQNKLDLQSSKKQFTNKLKISENQVKTYLNLLEEVKKQNKQLQMCKYSQEKKLTEMSCKIESLHSELKDKKSIIETHTMLKQNTSEKIDILQQKCVESKKFSDKMQARISELESEILQSNLNNKELGQKQKRLKEKVGERNEIIKEQERQISELKRKNEDSSRREIGLIRQNENLAVKSEQKESKVKAKQGQIEELSKKVEDLNAFIMALQKQLNQKTIIGRNYGGGQVGSGSNYGGSNYGGNYPSGFARVNANASSNILSSRISNQYKQKASEEPQERIEPIIKRYNGSIGNHGLKEEIKDRSKSPIRMVQQKEPEEEETNVNKQFNGGRPRPIKFKNMTEK